VNSGDVLLDRLGVYDDHDPDGVLQLMAGWVRVALEDVDLVARDDDQGRQGWERLFADLDTTPRWALDWIAVWAGIDPGRYTDQELRDAITVPEGLRRGTLDALRAAVQRTLTGSRYVRLLERSDPAQPGVDSPYHLTFITRTAETPDPAATYSAAVSQKAAGLVLHHAVVDGVTWDEAAPGVAWDDVPAGVRWDTVTLADVS
jgi:hypothetical protein